MSNFNISRAWGLWGETILGAYLKQQGWHIIRLGDITTSHGGPRAEAQNTEAVLTDLLRMKDGISRFTEAKVKDSPVLWRSGREQRHGIDLPYWQDYLRIEAISHIPGDLFIIELARTESDSKSGIYNPRILMQSLARLRDSIAGESKPHPEANQRHGMVYWQLSAFEIIAEDLGVLPSSILGETLKRRLHGWTYKASSSFVGRTCAYRLQDQTGKTIPTGNGSYQKCGKSCAPGEGWNNWLCSEHLEPVSDKAIARWLAEQASRHI